METQKTVTLGYNAFPWLPFFDASLIRGNKEVFLSIKYNPHGRILLALKKYLEFTKIFDRIDMIFEADHILRMDGSLGGLIGSINRSEADVGVTPVTVSEESTEIVGVCYPFRFEDYTFVTRKARYIPQIFGIFQTPSLSVWITIAFFLLAMMPINYIFCKGKGSSGEILLNVFAILLKQNALITPASLAEKLLIFS